MAPRIDGVLGWLKWPVAVWVMLSIPQLLEADIALIKQSMHPTFGPFWVGFVGYLCLWWTVFRYRGWGMLLPTILHELTHGLFAALTFHRILSISATWSSGGEIQYSGPGNWLITIAPYFFPLAMAVAVPLSAGLSVDATMRLALLGVVFGFESVAMWRQVHPRQTDLQKVGFVFAAVFLPGALLWSYGAILALVVLGPRGMASFLIEQGQSHSMWLIHLLG